MSGGGESLHDNRFCEDRGRDKVIRRRNVLLFLKVKKLYRFG